MVPFQQIRIHTNTINSSWLTRSLNICFAFFNDLDALIFFLALGWIFILYFIITSVIYGIYISRKDENNIFFSCFYLFRVLVG